MQMLVRRGLRPLLLIFATLCLVSCTSNLISPVAQLPTLAATQAVPTPLPTVLLPTPLPTASLTPTASVTPRPPTVTPIPPTATPLPSRYQQLLQNQPSERPVAYLSELRLIAFYGTPLGPALGILGDQPREEMIRQLKEITEIYADLSPDVETVPTFHIIVTVADKTPPYYRHHLNIDLITEWVELAESLQFAVILDIQPGHASPLYEMNRIRPLLYRPHVHLAIDPEFVTEGNQIPGRDLGQLYAKDINAIQEELNQIAIEIGVNRLLILHQFSGTMLPDKDNIINFENVEIVIDGDGVGYSETKINNYHRYANQPAFEFGGFKLFPTDGDSPNLSPQEIMDRLAPPPALIIYQ